MDAHSTLNEGVVILSSRPIELFDNVRLNVQEKKTRSPREVESRESEGRRMVRDPDSHQLFVGNIPHDVEKPELMDFFEQFGSVLDFKIICREKHPNFGFVVFNDSEPVQKILSSRPIELFDNVRLNVQKKKTHSPREVERGDARPRPGTPIGGGVRGPSSQGGGTNKPSLGSVLRLRPLLKPHPLCIWTFIKILRVELKIQTIIIVGAMIHFCATSV
uniref:RRM domain-containing protein n=1 Tax=Gouania willdenowi TaxID=441366 RepID=A0A8C5GS74_GOUWI